MSAGINAPGFTVVRHITYRFNLLCLLILVSLSMYLPGQLCADILQPGFNQSAIGAIPSAIRAFGVGIADFDGDTIPDIISGQTNGDVILFIGDGNGGFTNAGRIVNQAYNNAYGLSVADFNADNKMDFVLTMAADYTGNNIYDGEVHLYLGNGDGTFMMIGTAAAPQAGIVTVGDVGANCAAVTSGDIDGDTDIDVIAGDNISSANPLANIVLFRNSGNDLDNYPTFSAGETIDSAENVLDPEDPPYYPPVDNGSSYPPSYGLALGDMDQDEDLDLLVTDRAGYLYIYQNDGTGSFSPIRFERVDNRPYAYGQLHYLFAPITISCGDLNGDGLTDFITGGDGGAWEGAVDLWINTGTNGSGHPQFQNAGVVGQGGTDAKGLAIGQVNPSVDSFPDIVFGNYEAQLYALITDRVDTDGDNIIDLYDNAPLHWNAPRLDMNDDGGINSLDQLDNDQDGIGNPATSDDDDDGVDDLIDNSPLVPNANQQDSDADGIGDVSDPLNNTDTDSDGIFDGPFDPVLYQKAKQAKAIWSQDDTHFIIRIDALGRAFQNEFTQTMSDAAIWSPAEWDIKKLDNYNGIGDGPATSGYQVPLDLAGGKSTPITLVVIPRKIWNAFGDPDPIWWINDRISNPNLEISQHGSYHANNTMLGDWADDPSKNWYACETCGFTLEEMFEFLRIGKRTLLGDYSDWWIQEGGAQPGISPAVDWSNAANPLISYAPPYNASDTISRDATSRLGYRAFSASIYEENSSVFSPEGSQHEKFGPYGMFHASADLQVDPEAPGTMTYEEYLHSITDHGQLNTWLIEEVEWSTRYCNDTPRLESCPSAPGGINRENNMVDPERWEKWMTLLDFVNANGQPMTLGDYALAMAFDNAPTVSNEDQADADHDGIGDVIDGAVLSVDDVVLEWNGNLAQGTLRAILTNNGSGLAGQTVRFTFDTDGDDVDEVFSATTDADGIANVPVQVTLDGGAYTSSATWDGGVMQLNDSGEVTVPCLLLADLTGDCHVQMDDLSIFVSQWLQSGDPADCPLSADLAGNDCIVKMEDFAIMVSEWLE
ncbi:MAG: FG-GAP-like repeat-containing protein [Phycisphaerae bacterium]|nr:FG-GAP-like repeat-containing protein [Phycisphaerae bacterium]